MQIWNNNSVYPTANIGIIYVMLLARCLELRVPYMIVMIIIVIIVIIIIVGGIAIQFFIAPWRLDCKVPSMISPETQLITY